jgi:type VI secretion system FHA domain protein
MYLTLEVISPQAASLGTHRKQVVGPKGLTIGRAPDNDWVIPDPYISKQHARIVCTAGRFFVEGLGRNPIAIGAAHNTIPGSQARPLVSGDRLFIDQYEILVTGDDPGNALGSSGAAVELDPLSALGDGSSSRPVALPKVNWQQASALVEHYQPPRREQSPPQAQTIPDNWSRSILMPRPPMPEDDSTTSPRPASPQPQAELAQTPSPAPPTPAAHGLDLTALLRAAGVAENHLSTEVAQELGKVLRVVVNGVMQVLQARAEIKAQFRLPVTRVQAQENNPLKLSPNVESALHTLLVQRNPGYLPTVQAFEDAFADIRNHQLAMLEGLRVAFDAMLSAFDPQELQRDFDRSVKNRGLLAGLGTGAKYWDAYTERFGRFGKDADDTFRRLFGDAFANAYEMQLERLKKEGK